MIVSRKTRKPCLVETADDLLPFIRTISKDFRRLTPKKETDLNEFIKINQSIDIGTLRSFLKSVFPNQRGTQKCDFYFDVLGYNQAEWEERQKYYKERSIKRQQVSDNKSSLVFCQEYWISKFGEDGKQLYSQFQSNLSKRCSSEKKKQNSPRTIDYWTREGYGIKSASLKVSEFQSIVSPRCLNYWMKRERTSEEAMNSLHSYQSRGRDYWVKRLGEEEGNSKMDEINSRRFQNISHRIQFSGGFSKISQDLFHSLKNDEYTHFATYRNSKNNSKSRNEFVLKFDDGSWIFLDYVNTKTKKVIEFDGIYWHKGKEEFDAIRDQRIRDSGYEILRVTDKEYCQNKKRIIQKCQTYLEN